MALLDLAQPRTIQFADRGRTLTLRTHTVTKEDWLAYFKAMRITSERDGKGSITTIDVETPRAILAERVIIGAEGYRFSDGRNVIVMDGWQARLPVAHRRQVALSLADVQVAAPASAEGDFIIHAEGEEVQLNATWSAAGNGGMQRFEGLVHIFKTPTAAQHKRYNDASSRSVVTGGSRNGRTVYPNIAPLLIELYDELIFAVDGYAFEGQPLQTPSAIALRMDAFHKVTAVQELLNPTAVIVTADPEMEEEETA